jgi:hypothetical protein
MRRYFNVFQVCSHSGIIYRIDIRRRISSPESQSLATDGRNYPAKTQSIETTRTCGCTAHRLCRAKFGIDSLKILIEKIMTERPGPVKNFQYSGPSSRKEYIQA